MTDAPFSLDRLADVPRYVYKGSYMNKCDDKSGYDYVSVSPSWLPVEWVLVCLYYITFRLENLPVDIYQTICQVASGYLRARGIPCSLYIDDRLNGELVRNQGLWSILPKNRSQEDRFSAAIAAIYCVLSLLVDLGYTICITKSALYQTTSVEYLW